MWNGTNINSPMVGQTDLSLIQAGMIDDIQVFYGGASLAVNSGGMGGIINIESRPLWKNQSQVIINPAIGSFGRYTGLIKYKTGSDNFQSDSKAFINSSENDFKYVNSFFSASPFEEKRNNAQVFQTGFMQNLYFRSDKSVTSAHFWYQKSDRNLPALMVVRQTTPAEKQYDNFFRTLLQHKIYKAKSTCDFSFSWFSDKLNYVNSVAEIDSKNLSHTISVKSGFEFKPAHGTIIKASFSDNLIIIKSNNYDGNKYRNLISACASAEHVFGNRAGAVLLIRQNIKDYELLIPDFSLGFDFKLLNNHDYFIKGNISRNSRIPTMNDMYWIPGGNPALKNEYSYTCEVTLELNEALSPFFEINTEATLYDNHIHNMIQWQPGELLYWAPLNIGNVRSSGLEADLELLYISGPLSIRSNTGYSMTIAKNLNQADYMDFSNRKQLIYVPVHQINSGIILSYRNFYSSWIYNYTGKRFIATDNSQYLPGYSVNDIIIGLNIKLINSSIDINTRFGNIMGVNYQTIAYHPMPGRSFLISVLFKLIK
jgi:vitamin B12 transporter